MRKIAIYGVLAVSLLAAEPVLAQKSKVTTAVIAMRGGDLNKAKSAINEAANHDATKIDPDTWMYRGQIYKAISQSDKFRAAEPNAFDEAFNSFVKGIELDTRNKNADIRNEMKEMALMYYDLGSNAYNGQKYDIAFKNFSNYLVAINTLDAGRRSEIEKLLRDNKIDPQSAKLYAGYSAQQIKNNEKALQFYNELADAKYNEPLIYIYLSDIHKTSGDTAAALAALDKGMANVTDKKSLLIDKLNIYITRGQTKEALQLGQDALKLDPQNTSLIIAMGNIYDRLKMTKEAQEMYDRALAVDPNNLNTNYSIGISFFNQGAEKYNQSNETRDMKKSNALLAESKENFKKSIVYLEKALAANPEDKGMMKDILTSLKEMYLKLDNEAKFNEYNTRLKALK